MKRAKKKNQEVKNMSNIFTKETFGAVLLLFSTLCFIFLITWDKVFGKLGTLIGGFLYGVFGYVAVAVTIFGFIKGIFLIFNIKPKISFKRKLLINLAFLTIVGMLHIISLKNIQASSFNEYLSYSYKMGLDGFESSSAGGFIAGLYSFWFNKLSVVGGAVVLGLLFASCVYFFINDISKAKKPKEEVKTPNGAFNETSETIVEQTIEKTENLTDNTVNTVVENVVEKESKAKLFILQKDNFAFKTKKELKDKESPQIKVAKDKNGLVKARLTNSFAEQTVKDLEKKIEYIKMPAKINLDNKVINPASGEVSNDNGATTISNYIPLEKQPQEEQQTEKETQKEIPLFEHNEVKDDSASDETSNRAKLFAEKYASVNDEINIKPEEKTEIERPVSFENKSINIFEDKTKESVENKDIEEIIPESNISKFDFSNSKKSEETISLEQKMPTSENKVSEEIKPSIFERKEVKKEVKEEIKEKVIEEKPPIPINREYFAPPLDLLESHKMAFDEAEENHAEKQEIIKQTLSDFKIFAEPQGYVQGPSITRYEIMMPAGVSVNNVLKYDNDLRMRLASKNGVRIEAPIPGKNLVGIEVANKHPITVGIKEVLELASTKKCKPGSLMFALGKDIVGNAITDNLAKGPHFLVAGATGSGKSVCLNVMIVSLIMRYSPEELRFILVDPKRVGFRCYEHLPHLLIDEIITEPQRVLAVLTWAYEEMERRYKMFEECTEVISDIEGYNQRIASSKVAKMPRIVIIVDELADLMETCKKDMDSKIRMLAQKARAAGIHLVLATQRPSVDIITGTIKANLPSRIALKVMNFNDSQTILGEAGAEKLLGNGDMLYKNSSMPEFERYQGAWISDQEIHNVVSYIRDHNTAYFDDGLAQYLDKETKPKVEENDEFMDGEDDFSIESDEFFVKALWLAVSTGYITSSYLQRKFRIGYSRAGSLVDEMERLGYVSAKDGAKPRQVLLSKEEFEQKYGTINGSEYY
ncbi:MAG: hypothetical protein MJ066_00205 [Clostridia bacterium]|nr:hypothetical protein [Clostridia bacterium]